jgi:hypothetical protein
VEVAEVTIYPSNELSAYPAESLRTVTIRRDPVRGLRESLDRGPIQGSEAFSG